MKNIILFQNETNKTGINNKKSKKTPEKTGINGSRTGAGSTIEMNTERKRKYWKKIEEDEEERFREKYNDILAAVPNNAEAKLQYFADVMLHLLPDIFHTNDWVTKFDTWLDFCEFYISYFDAAYSDYIQANKKYGKPYQYKFEPMTLKKVEEELEDCLRKITEMCPEKGEEDKTGMLYQAARLFELEEILSNLFYQKIIEE